MEGMALFFWSANSDFYLLKYTKIFIVRIKETVERLRDFAEEISAKFFVGFLSVLGQSNFLSHLSSGAFLY